MADRGAHVRPGIVSRGALDRRNPVEICLFTKVFQNLEQVSSEFWSKSLNGNSAVLSLSRTINRDQITRSSPFRLAHVKLLLLIEFHCQIVEQACHLLSRLPARPPDILQSLLPTGFDNSELHKYFTHSSGGASPSLHPSGNFWNR